MQVNNHRLSPAMAAPVRGSYAENYPADSVRLSDSQIAMKNLFDRSLALVGLIVAAPIMGMVALLVRLTSRGPAVYAQLRIGYHGKLFHCYKFRSMYHECEKSSGAVWASRNDSRITPLGKILRATYLDELPQLLNVLMGDMSMVGPRPERPEITAKLRRQFPNDYYKRLLVKPGITGLAQINQHSDLDISDVRRKLHYDLLYVRNMSLWLDIKTMLGTLSPILTRSHQTRNRRRTAAPAKSTPAPHIALADSDSRILDSNDSQNIGLSTSDTHDGAAVQAMISGAPRAEWVVS